MLLAILLLLVFALLAPGLDRFLKEKSGWLLAALSAALFAWFAATAPGLHENLSWMPSLHVALDFHLDGFGRLFALLITGIGSIILLYSPVYLAEDPERGRFMAFLLLFQASMLGVAVADNFLLFFVFWEMTGISSYLLISHYRQEERSRWNALQALLVTSVGGLALLAGLILLGLVSGEWQFSSLLDQGLVLHQHPQYRVILGLVLLGALTKSAQFPFHFWLPNAMVAPTPTSAFLHSATMVKAGIVLLVKLSPILSGTEAWTGVLVVLGGLTAALGAGRGLIQTDLKEILAYSTLSVLGLLTLLLGLGTELAQKTALLLLCGHALYKAALFLVVGNLDHATGTRQITLLGGLRRAMPWTAAAALLAALSMAGFPPFFGFLGKEYVYKSSTYLDQWIPFLVAPTLFANMLLFAMALKVGWHPFWSRSASPAANPKAHESPWEMWLGPLLLGVCGLLLGLFPQTWLAPLLEPALADMTGHPVTIQLSLWHGFQLPFLLSLLTISGGSILYASRRAVWQRVAPLHPEAWTLDRLYRKSFHQVVDFSRLHTAILQSGSLSRYLTIILLLGCCLLLYEITIIHQPFAAWAGNHLGIVEISLFVLAVGGAGLATLGTSTVLFLTGLGTVGFTIAVYYVLYAAPDLAITQILVETLTLVLFVLVIRRLPRLRPQGRPRVHFFQAVLAGTVGLLVCLLLMKAQAWQVAPSIGSAFGDLSYPEGKGKNVVNVILVDFRAFDTLGEITVLAVAALGVATLVSRRSGKEDKT